MTRDEKRKYDRERRAKVRQEFFKDKCCNMCGSLEKLELHHIDPSQKESHTIWSWAEERRLVELAKCTVLCYDCHKIETKAYLSKLNTKPFPHGVYSGYRRGCRCTECRAIYKVKRKAHFERTGN